MNSADNNKFTGFFLASPWLLATASMLLALIIGVFAVNNFQREKKLMQMALIQEGRTVLNLVSSSSRAALRNQMRQSAFDDGAWIQSVQEIIENGSEHQGILTLFLIDTGGLILAHNETGKVGTEGSESLVRFLNDSKKQERSYSSRILPKTAGTVQRFQITSSFNLPEARKELLSNLKDTPRGRMGRMMWERIPSHELERMLDRFPDKSLYLVAELDMTAFQHQVRKQFIYIVVLSIVLLLVGIGGLLSLVAIQGFKGSQKKLKTITAFTDLLIASMPLGIIALDADGIIKTCNSSGIKMLGLDNRAVGKHYSDSFPEKLAEQFGILISQKNVMSETDIIIENLGIDRNFHIMSVPLFRVDEIDSGHMLLIQDMTTQKNLESELRRNERHTALGKMAAGVAHELRNPLSSIKGLALLLKSKTQRQSSAAEAAEILISEVERLDRSISELLDYSRPENPSFAEIELLSPIKKAIRLIRSDAAAEEIEIIEAYEDGDQLIKGDPDKLTQLFLNLFLNSLQAMSSGGRLSVATRRDVGKIIITVDDSGAGVEEEFREKIFDPYFTTKSEGTGLGLSICAKIVEDHQGTISITARKSHGTRVTITLPV